MSDKLEIRLGGMAPALQEQLSGMPLSADEVDLFQRCADAITLLSVQDVLPPGEIAGARRRLTQNVARKIIAARKRAA